jgi:hypothetical protein
MVMFLCSCDKGYEVRFSNFYITPMDSVTINGTSIVFTNIGLQTTTDYKKISKGKYAVSMVARDKKKFSTTLNVPSNGTGKYTIQIDGISQVAVLEE